MPTNRPEPIGTSLTKIVEFFDYANGAPLTESARQDLRRLLDARMMLRVALLSEYLGEMWVERNDRDTWKVRALWLNEHGEPGQTSEWFVVPDDDTGQPMLTDEARVAFEGRK